MKQKLCLLAGVILCILFVAPQVQAQKTAVLKSLSNFSVEDTIINAGVKYQSVASNAYAETAFIKATITKISGTVACTVIAAGSFSTAGPWYPLDTLTATDVASQDKFLEIKNTKYFFYRVQYTGSGTMAAKLRSTLKAK